MELQDALRQFILDKRAANLSPDTIGWYRRMLSRLLRFLAEQGVSEVSEVAITHLRAFVVSLQTAGLGPHSVHTYAGALRIFFNWLVAEEVIGSSPAARLKSPHLPDCPPKAITPDDLRRLLETAKPDARDYAIVCFLADTACRVGGLVRLRLTDLDLGNGRALVREKGHGGGKVRTVYFNGRTRAALMRWLKVRPGSDDNAVFLSKKSGRALTTRGVWQALKRLAKRAGVKGRFNPHAFRHGWAREALRNGASLADVSQVLGHSSIAVTARFYTRWADRELQKRHGQFSPLADPDSD